MPEETNSSKGMGQDYQEKQRTNTIRFQEAKNGYDKEQVDRYIRMVAKEYQRMHGEYTALLNSINEKTGDESKLNEQLESENRTLAAQLEYNRRINRVLNEKLIKLEQNNSDAKMKAIARALIDAEIMAKQIIDNAKAEAAAIREGVNREITQITIND